MPLYDALADMPLTIESYGLEALSRQWSPEMTRHTTVVALQGRGETGIGEDVTYGEAEQLRQQRDGAILPLAGDWTIESFSRHLEGLDLFGGAGPDQHAYANYRRWAFESAAGDLALRQAGRSLHDVLGRAPRPLRFVVSLRLGDPASADPVKRRIAAYPGIGFKLDAEPNWDDELLARLAETGTVAAVDFKGHYKGTPVDVPTDAGLYRRVAEAFPEAILEDPDLEPPDADAALAPHRDRISFDAPIHSVDDVLALSFRPHVLNSKPSRFGSWRELLRFYDFCETEGIRVYSGGQSELGPGRGQVQLLSAMFHADEPNDIAPSGYDWNDFPHGLAPNPLDPAPEPTGFRRRS
jgi:L-alanine-DL-glutamate epimerase-like enolase superfamily enzyme